MMFHLRYKYRWSLLAAILISNVMLPSAYGQQPPDPALLVEGVEAARLQIPPSTLKLKYKYKDALAAYELDMGVDFDGDLHGFSYTAPGDKKETKTVFDGQRVIIYDPNLDRLEYRNLEDRNTMKLFDVRLLGLSTYNSWGDTIKSTLPQFREENAKLELVGKERVGENSAWHVHFSKPFGPGMVIMDYWIDDQNGFRVYRKDFNGVQTFSYYENEKYPWLPSRVIAKRFNNDNTKIEAETEIQVIEAKVNQIPATRWTLAGMGLKVPTEVLDVSLKRRIGDWNGTKFVPATLETPGSSSETKKSQQFIRLIILAVFIVPPLVMAFMAFNKRRQNRNDKGA